MYSYLPQCDHKIYILIYVYIIQEASSIKAKVPWAQESHNVLLLGIETFWN